MYSEKVLDHFEHPRNLDALDDQTAEGMKATANCGDKMQMYQK